MIATPNSIPKVKGYHPFKVLMELNNDILAFLLKYPATYGNTFKCQVLQKELTITSDPIWLKHILQTNHKVFGRGRAYEELKLALGNGLLVNDGESWMTQRRLAQPAFYKQRLNGLFETMEKIGNNMIQDLEAKRGKEIAITDYFWTVTSDIVIESLLGGDGPQENKDLQDAILDMQKFIIKRIRSPLSIPLTYINGQKNKFDTTLETFNQWVYSYIEKQRVQNSDGNNLLSMLMQAEDADTGEKMSDKQLRDEVITIYVAGHETSTFALSWTLYLLAQHPEIYRKVKAEVEQIQDIENIGFKGIHDLVYLNQVLLESMRIYPPAYVFGRKVLEDTIIDNTLVKKNDNIIINVYALHKDPNYWESPLEFNPDRFNPEEQKKRDKFVYVPFGAGPRMCIGNNFAIMEIIMLLAKFIYHFDFELMNKEKVTPEPLITLRPKQSIIMKLT